MLLCATIMVHQRDHGDETEWAHEQVDILRYTINASAQTWVIWRIHSPSTFSHLATPTTQFTTNGAQPDQLRCQSAPDRTFVFWMCCAWRKNHMKPSPLRHKRTARVNSVCAARQRNISVRLL